MTNQRYVPAWLQWIDVVGLSLIGLLSYLYMLFYSGAAEVQLRLSFLDFPIFIGEMVMILAAILFCVKIAVKVGQGSFRWNWWHWALLFYFLFVLIKALRGYAAYGPLSFRNAAMFYYAVFAVFTFEFYNPKLWNQCVRWSLAGLLLLTLVFLIRLHNIFNEYFLLTAFLCYLLVTLHIKPNWGKYLFLICLIALPYNMFFVSSRTNMIGLMCGIPFLVIYLMLMQNRFNRKQTVLGGIFCLVVVLVSVYLNEPTQINSMINQEGLKQEIAKYDGLYEDLHEHHNFMQLDVNLYNENQLMPRSAVIYEEMKQATVMFIRTQFLQRIREKNDEDYREFFENNWSVIQQEIEGYLDREKLELSSGKDVEMSIIIRLIEEQYSEHQVKSEAQKLTQRNPNSHNVGNITSKPKSKPKIKSAGYTNKPENRNENLDHMLREFEFEGIPKLEKAFKESLESGSRTEAGNQGTVVFRILIWRDMLREFIRYKPWFGFNFGMPQRSKFLEVLNIGVGEWSRDGWITPHNLYIHVLYRAGLVGLVFIAALIGLLCYMISAGLKYHAWKLGLLIAPLIYWLAASACLVVLELPYYSIPFWSLFGIAMAYTRRLGLNAEEQQ